LLPAPTTSDEYRFGFGVDLVSFISQLTGGGAKNAAAAAASAQKSGGTQPITDTSASPGSGSN
jgi:hypothetical protein